MALAFVSFVLPVNLEQYFGDEILKIPEIIRLLVDK
jgi:hypothetical protein